VQDIRRRGGPRELCSLSWHIHRFKKKVKLWWGEGCDHKTARSASKVELLRPLLLEVDAWPKTNKKTGGDGATSKPEESKGRTNVLFALKASPLTGASRKDTQRLLKKPPSGGTLTRKKKRSLDQVEGESTIETRRIRQCRIEPAIVKSKKSPIKDWTRPREARRPKSKTEEMGIGGPLKPGAGHPQKRAERKERPPKKENRPWEKKMDIRRTRGKKDPANNKSGKKHLKILLWNCACDPPDGNRCCLGSRMWKNGEGQGNRKKLTQGGKTNQLKVKKSVGAVSPKAHRLTLQETGEVVKKRVFFKPSET